MSWRTRGRVPRPTSTTNAFAQEEEEAPLPVSDQRTLYLVNIFIADTVSFFNRFSAICEEKLAEAHRRMMRLDATLSLLEAKLNSIDGVEELEEHAGFDIVRPLDQSIPENSLNMLNPLVTGRSDDPSSSSVNIQHETSLPLVQTEVSHSQYSMDSKPHQHIRDFML